MSRTVLAEAYQAIPDNDAAVVELEAAQSIFERLGALDGARRAAELLSGGRAAEATTGTFLFTDICGSTNLLEAIGDAAWHDFVEWHDRTLRALFGEHGGEEVDHAGDGFFVAFRETRAALACAVEIQQVLVRQRREHGFAPAVRIGVHMAARIGSVATANEIVASRETAVAGRFGFSNLRALELKGLSTPVDVVTVDWA